ncbi:hypothetical protein [Enterococcus sp. 2201sp1_2201st1_C11_2201SCRN_220225]|uniref:hypothetical protein n=1 Tax=Enterococcus sp. 2201sp1_2201st1_C11_2201SCRN_220225 TaxID=3141593 RepID=UPI0034A23451
MENLQSLVLKLLPKLKQLLKIPSDQVDLDEVLKFSLETEILDVLNYCNLEDLPWQLENTVVMMTKDLLEATQLLLSADEVSEGQVKSITEGDFAITKATSAEMMAAMVNVSSFSQNYEDRLNSFRKFRW